MLYLLTGCDRGIVQNLVVSVYFFLGRNATVVEALHILFSKMLLLVLLASESVHHPLVACVADEQTIQVECCAHHFLNISVVSSLSICFPHEVSVRQYKVAKKFELNWLIFGVLEVTYQESC